MSVAKQVGDNMAKSTALKAVDAQSPAEYDYGDDFEQYAGAGMETLTSKDLLVPMLDILHFSSKEISQDGFTGRPGDMIIRTLGEVYSGRKGLIFVPAATREKYVEWTPKDSGGGVVGQYEPRDPYVTEIRERNGGKMFGKLYISGIKDDKTSNYLSETHYVAGILGLVSQDDPDDYTVIDTRQVIIPFSSTKIRVHKEWASKADRIMLAKKSGGKMIAPLWLTRYRLSTKLTRGKGDHQWFVYDIHYDGPDALAARMPLSDPLLQEAKAVWERSKRDTIQVDMHGIEPDDADESSGGGTYTRNEPKAGAEDIPF